MLFCLRLFQGEWKPKQISNPAYKGQWIHPEIDNPAYSPDDSLYKYSDIGTLGFDLWQVRNRDLYFSQVILIFIYKYPILTDERKTPAY